jgi:hypothetical protein
VPKKKKTLAVAAAAENNCPPLLRARIEFDRLAEATYFVAKSVGRRGEVGGGRWQEKK